MAQENGGLCVAPTDFSNSSRAKKGDFTGENLEIEHEEYRFQEGFWCFWGENDWIMDNIFRFDI